MKKTALIIMILSFLYGLAHARSSSDVEKDLVMAAKTAAATYKTNGMAGLIDTTNKCYKIAKQNKFYCVYLDLASRHIDQILIDSAANSGRLLPKTEFFDDKMFGARVIGVFNKANWDMGKSNEYLLKLTPIINKLVEEHIYGQKKPSLTEAELIAFTASCTEAILAPARRDYAVAAIKANNPSPRPFPEEELKKSVQPMCACIALRLSEERGLSEIQKQGLDYAKPLIDEALSGGRCKPEGLLGRILSEQRK